MNNQQNLKLEFKKEQINNYNESFENTMNNVYAASVILHQIFARLGYQIKLQEQILEHLKKMSEGK